jgi:hypothetical protein
MPGGRAPAEKPAVARSHTRVSPTAGIYVGLSAVPVIQAAEWVAHPPYTAVEFLEVRPDCTVRAEYGTPPTSVDAGKRTAVDPCAADTYCTWWVSAYVTRVSAYVSLQIVAAGSVVSAASSSLSVT